jgi:hypothetical protein
MKNALKTILALSAMLTLAPAASQAEIIWSQPSIQNYQYNTHFRGNATLTRADVRKLQAELARRHYYKGPIDGIWGGRTTQALLDYQATHDLPLTGTLDRQTVRELGINVCRNCYRDHNRRYDRRYDRYDRYDRDYYHDGYGYNR